MEAHSDTGDELYAYDVLFVLCKLMENGCNFVVSLASRKANLFWGNVKVGLILSWDTL